MNKLLCLLLSLLLLLTGCSGNGTPADPLPSGPAAPSAPVPDSFRGTMVQPAVSAPDYRSRFREETLISLSDTAVTVNGGPETAAVYTSHDILYYEDRDYYDSGYPYGEGTAADRHSPQEASGHTVVNITAPGAYRITGCLSAGQIRVDLGEDACEDPAAVVELILENTDITCTVGPAILFLNVYECDTNWSVDTAKPDVDTSDAGANLILEGENTVTGSHVAKIFQDREGEKKLWKQDGAIYSYMSLNVFGPGSLTLTADNEGLDTQLHLTVNGGSITIRSDNDGINTNEDGVSVTTVNGGTLHIIAGLGAEGDGIDSNGYLVINGGTVVACANPAADAGMDSDLGSYIHGGTVIALGSAMDWAESDSRQVTLNLQFAQYRSADSALVAADPDGTVLFAYDPGADEILGSSSRRYMGAIVSCPSFTQGSSCYIYLGGTLTGEETGGIYTEVTDYRDGQQMCYTGTDVRMRPGAFPSGGPMSQSDFPGPEEGEMPPEGFDREGEDGFPGHREEYSPQGEDRQPPEGFDPEQLPEGFDPNGPPQGFGGPGDAETVPVQGQGSTLFYLQDMVNFFSGITAAAE